MKTKTGNLSRYWGRQFSFTLAVLLFTTVFIWSWENNPLVTSMLSAQEQFMVHTSDFLVNEPAESSIFTNPIKDNSKEFVPLQEAETKEPAESSIIFRPDVTIIPTYEENDEISSSSLGTKVCDYTRGRWIADRRRPLYSGLGCKQWLSEMWSCRLTQRTDFSYEGYRWQPQNCDMPDFKGSEFLNKMWNKTIAFIGDSLGRQQFQSLMCMVTAGEDRPEVEEIGWKYGLLIHPGAIRPDGWAFRFPYTNTTILYYWSATLTGIEPINATDPATEFAMHLDRPPSFLEEFISQFDVVVLNTGHHWNRGKVNANKWVMHANRKPVVDRKLAQIGNAKNLTVYSITRWLDSQMPLYPGLKAFFRTISPRHFFNGEWNTGGSCNNTKPLTRGSEVQQDESSDPVISEAVKGTKVKLLDITSISELRDEGHISHYTIKSSNGINDCLHWCLPGIPDTWNELLCAQL